jgi:hypothetical protein
MCAFILLLLINRAAADDRYALAPKGSVILTMLPDTVGLCTLNQVDP